MNKAFTIQRSKWLNGDLIRESKGQIYSALLNPQVGKMCCLGFYGKACGLTEADIEDRSTVQELEHTPQEMAWLTTFDDHGQRTFDLPSNICHDLMDANDSYRYTPNEREANIIALFAKQGITVTFED